MASSSVSLTIFAIITIFITAAYANALNNQQLKETNMTLYFQDVSAGPNATLVAVAGVQGKHWSMSQFGTVYVSDDPITEGPDRNSAPVGFAQGMHVIASSDGRITTHAIISLVFTNEAYKGSTLQIAGSRKHYDVVREDAVVSGTGVFRYARGYVTFETYFADNATAHSVIQVNVSVLHY